MGWEKRSNGVKYFYVSRREGGRVVKDYYGNGAAAQLAEQQLEARKQQRKADREAVRAAKAQLSIADSAVDQLARSIQSIPVELASTASAAQSPDRGDSPLKGGPRSPKSTFVAAEVSHHEQTDPISCIQELLSRVQRGDPTADSELETLLDRYPDLCLLLGDVEKQALQSWLTLVSGNVPVLAMAARKKLEALRAELLAGGTDVATRMHTDRILATWLQVTYADARYAQADRSCLPMLEFLARRQKQAQQQHLAAWNAWRLWRRAQGNLGVTPVPSNEQQCSEDPKENSAVTTARAATKDTDDWILPFPRTQSPAEAM